MPLFQLITILKGGDKSIRHVSPLQMIMSLPEPPFSVTRVTARPTLGDGHIEQMTVRNLAQPINFADLV